MIKFNDMVINKSYKTFVQIEQVSMAITKTNKKYLDLKLFDGETSLSAKSWNHSGEAPLLGSILAIDTTMGEYLGERQLVVNTWRLTTDDDEVNKNDFVKHSSCTYEELDRLVMHNIAKIVDKEYYLITLNIYNEFKEDYLNAPAAMKHHQNYIGGLAEHSLGVTNKALALSTGSDIDTSLLLSGALLHDIGKIFTYDWSGMSIKMTDRGKLLDHIVLGIQIMQYMTLRLPKAYPELCTSATFRNKMLLLTHIIASHHGKQQYGSPVTPHIPEAFYISQADASDAVSANIQAVLGRTSNDKSWTEYVGDLSGELLQHLDNVTDVVFNELQEVQDNDGSR